MTRQNNIDALEKMGNQCIENNDLSIFDEIWADHCVDHDPAPDQGPGAAGLKQFWSDFLSAFPDLSIEVDHMVATDDHVAMAYTVSGTHDGSFMAIAATGKPVSASGVQISRHGDDGRIVERWGQSDVLGIMQQIGALDT